MAKSENPLDVYRRQQRKKELKKNKNARIRARDEKVAATRSIDEVKAEISQLERKRDKFGKSRGDKTGVEGHDDEDTSGGLDSNEAKKLERLRKELKIVTAESARRKELHEQAQREKERQLIASQKTVEGVKKLNESKYSVLERYASVYYDEQMNPFGAPPPGKPQMYWKDAEKKTTTMNARMAVVPSQMHHKFDAEMKKQVKDDVVNSQDGVSGRKRRWDERGPGMHSQPQFNNQIQQHASPPPPPSYHKPPPPPSFQKTPAPPPPPPPPPVVVPPPPLPPPPVQTKDVNGQPALPAPSKAVLRAAKRNKTSAMADIWASTEEMQYEQSLGVDLEGAIDDQQQLQQNLPRWLRNKQKKSKKDEADVNDPVNPSSEGYGEYRNREQIERQSKEVSMRQKEQIDHANQLMTSQQKKQEQLKVSENAWYYRDNSSGSVQGPFSREQMLGWRDAGFFPPTTPIRFGHGEMNEEFIALLEVDFTAPTGQAAPPPPPPPPPFAPELAAVAYPSIDDVIVEENTLELQPYDDDDGHKRHISEAELAEPLPSGEEDNGADNYAEVDMCLPPPSDDEGDEIEECIPPPSDDEQDEFGNNGTAANGDEIPSYYPHGEITNVPYPVDDDVVDYPDTSYAYPNTDDAYGDMSYDNIPAVAPYPNADDTTEDSETKAGLPPPEEKKKYDGDKAVVGFMPSHLRRKRPAPKKSAPKVVNATVTTAATSSKNSVSDDYDKFMNEITALK
ncbi:hypothetical protein ACHAXM_005518 [Skeletonema potamos]